MKQITYGAIILAAGQGSRMGNELPKAFIELQDKPLLQYSIEAFSQSPFITEIIVVLSPNQIERFEHAIQNDLQIPEPIRFEIVAGGDERQDSALNGVMASNSDWVFVHDAARPLVSQNLLKSLIEASDGSAGVIPTLPVVDSLRRVNKEQRVIENIDRQNLHAVQTPQLFPREALREALSQAKSSGVLFTDEAGCMMELSELPIRAVKGSSSNFKVTTQEDLLLAEFFLKFPDLSV